MRILLTFLLFSFIKLCHSQFEFVEELDLDFSNGYNVGFREALLFDKDQDGDLDILTTTWFTTSRLYWYENLGGGDFGERQVFFDDGSIFRHFHTFDMDLDGDLDLHVSSSTGDLAFLENMGSGEFEPRYFGNGLNNTFKHSTILFANDDLYPDLAMLDCTYGDSIHFAIYLNDQNGGFTYGSPLSANGGFEGDVEAGDLDQDGDEDILLTRTVNDESVWFENLGNGTFGEAQMLMENVGYMYCGSIKDFDQDGYNDIFLCASSTNYLFLLKGIGPGQFSSPIEVEYYPSIDYINWGDMDSDGDEDAITVSNSGGMHYLENTGNAQFAAPVVYETYPYIAMADVGDIDGDGALDVVLAGVNNNVLRWYANQQGPGCIDPQACNYNSWAVADNGSCSFPDPGDFNCDGVLNDTDIDSIIDNFGCLQNCSGYDLDGDGQVGMSDIFLLISWL